MTLHTTNISNVLVIGSGGSGLRVIMHFNGYQYQEIADHLEFPLGTIKSKIFFARKELKELVNKRYSNNFSLS